MGAALRGRVLPAAAAILGAAVAAVAVAAAAAAARVAVAGGAAVAASAHGPGAVDTGGAAVDAGSAVRVVGGEEVQDGDWEGTQFMVKLLRSEPGGFRFNCGGSLFRPNKVITAAHCIGPSSIRVGDLAQVGGLTFRQGLSSRIASIAVHPDWDPTTKRADIAVLTLANPRTTAKYDTINVRKMGINRVPSEPAVGTVLTVAGWGQPSGRAGSTHVTRLRRANVTIAAWEDCVATGIARRAPLPGGLEEFALCTSGAAERTSACTGDSGGPLYYRDRSPTGRLVYRVAGISSFVLSDVEDANTNTVKDDCPPGTLSYFTRVSAFASWIDEQMDPGWRGWERAP